MKFPHLCYGDVGLVLIGPPTVMKGLVYKVVVHDMEDKMGAYSDERKQSRKGAFDSFQSHKKTTRRFSSQAFSEV
jgi:hypothetical protein